MAEASCTHGANPTLEIRFQRKHRAAVLLRGRRVLPELALVGVAQKRRWRSGRFRCGCSRFRREVRRAPARASSMIGSVGVDARGAASCARAEKSPKPQRPTSFRTSIVGQPRGSASKPRPRLGTSPAPLSSRAFEARRLGPGRSNGLPVGRRKVRGRQVARTAPEGPARA